MIETWDDFVRKVKGWAEARNLIKGSTIQAQGLKGLSEAGELADNFAKGKDIKDDIGDCCVVAVITMLQHDMGEETFPVGAIDTTPEKAVGEIAMEFAWAVNAGYSASSVPDYALTICQHKNIDFIKCLNTAWDDIKDRKGIMHNGVFIKESDPRYKELVDVPI
jgi:hypothetical protein